MAATAATGAARPVRVGGQALADGVLMRTPTSWAIAREDGSVEVGTLPAVRWGSWPLLRVLGGLVAGFRVGIARGMLGRGAGTGPGAARSRRLNGRFVAALVAVEVAAVVVAWGLARFDLRGIAAVLAVVAPWAVTFAVLRVVSPPALWRYHGAEHKAVAAHEAGIDLADTASVLACDRVHDRCGTNLVFVMAVTGLALVERPVAAQLLGFVLLLGAAAEVISLAARRPGWLPSRVLLGGGKALQRWVTTAEPTPAEQGIGCLALRAALAEHARLQSLDPASVQLEPALVCAA